jgi:PAS domain S-box-containing protein
MGAEFTLSSSNALATVSAALDGSDHALAVVVGDALVVAWANDAFGRLTGGATSAIGGQELPRLLGVAADQPGISELRDGMRQRRPIESELHCARLDGARYWFEYALMPTPDGSSVVLGRDVTKPRQARQQAATAEALLATVYRQIEVAVAIVDADSRILMANPAFDQLIAGPAGAAVGLKLLALAGPTDRATIVEMLTQNSAEGEPATVPTSLLRGDGSRIEVRLNAMSVERADLRRFRVVTAAPAATALRAERMCFTIAGKIRLIGLDEFKAVIGLRWQHVAERALQSAEHILRKHLGPRDSFTRTDDHGLLICFAELSEDDATLAASTIAGEIRQRLIGQEPAAAHTQVIAHVARVDHPEHPSDLPLRQLLEVRLHARRASIEATARQTLAAAITEARPKLLPILQRDGAMVAQYAQIPSGVQARVAAAAAALPADEAAGFDLELYRLRLIAEAARESLANGIRAPVHLDLDFAILETRLRTEQFVEALMKFEPNLREQLILMLTNPPEGITATRLRDCLLRLRPYCRDVGLAPSRLEPPPDCVMPGSSLTMALPCEAILEGGVIVDDRLFQLIPQLHARRVRLLIRDVPDPDRARDLREIGVDLIGLSPAALS